MLRVGLGLHRDMENTPKQYELYILFQLFFLGYYSPHHIKTPIFQPVILAAIIVII